MQLLPPKPAQPNRKRRQPRMRLLRRARTPNQKPLQWNPHRFRLEKIPLEKKRRPPALRRLPPSHLPTPQLRTPPLFPHPPLRGYGLGASRLR
jgi:hypothetical protein